VLLELVPGFVMDNVLFIVNGFFALVFTDHVQSTAATQITVEPCLSTVLSHNVCQVYEFTFCLQNYWKC